MQKVDFSKVVIKNVDGSEFSREAVNNTRKSICNKIYSNAREIPLMELAQKLWHADKVVEMSDGEIEMWRKELNDIPAFVRRAFVAVLEGEK